MENFLLYIGKTAVAVAAFYLTFLLLFQNRKQFIFNRIYLSVSMAISFVIPLLTFTTVRYVEPTAITINNFSSATVENMAVQQSFSTEWFHYMLAFYSAGIAIFLLRLLLGHFKAFRIIRKCQTKSIFGKKVSVTEKDIHPFSFFNKIVIPERILRNENLEMVISHEYIHVKEKHTLDILLMEILFVLQWFNPFAWLMKAEAKNNLEYKTDDQIVLKHDALTYQLAMISMADKDGIAPFLIALNGSQLKTRIIMMKKKTADKFTLWKKLLVVPILAVLVLGLSRCETETVALPGDETLELNDKSAPIGNTVSGKITDENGEPLAGAAVILKSRPIGTITNVDGNFVIALEEKTDTFVFVMDGYEKQEVVAEAGETLTIKLKTGSVDSEEVSIRSTEEVEDPIIIIDGVEFEGNISDLNPNEFSSVEVFKGSNADTPDGEKITPKILITTKKAVSGEDVELENLEKIEAIGYSSVTTNDEQPIIKKGSVSVGEIGSTAHAGALEDVVVVGYGQQKSAEDAQVTPNEDGQIRIRGIGSTSGKKPLYVVDGKATEGIDDLSPNDIQNITILKDESAVETYGDKAKDGVVIITTKNAHRDEFFQNE